MCLFKKEYIYKFLFCLQNLLDTLPDYTLPDFFTSIVKATTDEKLEILDATNLTERFKLAQPLLIRQIEV